MLDSNSKVNAMTLVFASKLGLKVRFTNVEAQKIDGSTLTTYKMVIATFQADNKFGRAQFVQKSFLVAKTSVDVILGMLFLAFNNANIKFAAQELTWRSYIAVKILSTTK